MHVLSGCYAWLKWTNPPKSICYEGLHISPFFGSLHLPWLLSHPITKSCWLSLCWLLSHSQISKPSKATLFPPREECECIPHYHKLCSGVSHIWGNYRSQHTWSAKGEPHPGKTTFVIVASPLSGKYSSQFLRMNIVTKDLPYCIKPKNSHIFHVGFCALSPFPITL